MSAQAVQIESRCGAEKHKGDRLTLETYEFVCDLPAGHGGMHEGTVRGGTLRLGWPSSASTIPGRQVA